MKTPRLTFFDYIKAAFNLRVDINGLGGVPLNWVFVAVSLIFTFMFGAPILLICGSLEFLYLLNMANSQRFQQIIRSRHGSRTVAEGREQLDDSVEQNLRGSDHVYDYRSFAKKCDGIMEIVRTIVGRDEASLEMYSGNLLDFCQSYALLLRMQETIESQVATNDDKSIKQDIVAMQAEISKPGISERIKASKESNLKTMQDRLSCHEQQRERLELTKSEIERLHQQVELLADQVVLAKDPTSLSQKMDTASAVMEENTAWLAQNSDLMQDDQKVVPQTITH